MQWVRGPRGLYASQDLRTETWNPSPGTESSIPALILALPPPAWKS